MTQLVAGQTYYAIAGEAAGLESDQLRFGLTQASALAGSYVTFLTQGSGRQTLLTEVFGGRASGPAPLIDLFTFTTSLFKHNAGRKLSSYDCHNLMCMVGEVVVSGGVIRSAMISLSNLSDGRMRHAKSGQWWETAPQMALSNNSVCYTDKPDGETFLREWTSLVESKSGERGIFNRLSAKEQAKKFGRRDADHEFGTNPCSEIILRPYQFCNLTEVVIREKDKFDDLKRNCLLYTSPSPRD